jgi:hypothetical protein
MGKKSYKSVQSSVSTLMKELPDFRSGLFSLVNAKGHIRFNDYMQGNDADDLSKDWKAIGKDFEISMREINHFINEKGR